MDDLDLIKKRLATTPMSRLYRLSKDTKVPYGTLWNLKERITRNPRFETVRLLAAHFKK